MQNLTPSSDGSTGDIILSYLPFAGLDERQIAIIAEPLRPYYKRRLQSGRGSIDEHYASVADALARWRTLRRIRAVEYLTITVDTDSSPERPAKMPRLTHYWRAGK